MALVLERKRYSSIEAWLETLPLEVFQGLTPGIHICLTHGFSREDLKSRLLKQTSFLCGQVITQMDDLALAYLKLPKEALLTSLQRQEILRMLFSNPSIRKSLRTNFKELREMKRDRGFFRKCDEALQAGRKTYAHDDELNALESRAHERFGTQVVREELKRFSHAYEAWCEAKGKFDRPMLLRKVLGLSRQDIDSKVPVVVLTQARQTALESLEEAFFEHIGAEIIEIGVSEKEKIAKRPKLKLWHSTDDAAESLIDDLILLSSDLNALSQTAVLIPDDFSVRRSLARALRQAGVPQADPRDPLDYRTDELYKQSVLGLEVVSSQYERETVKAYLKLIGYGPIEIKEIDQRGIQRGLGHYVGGKLTLVHQELTKLHSLFSHRMTAREAKAAHFQWLIGLAKDRLEFQLKLPFWEKFWEQLCVDFDLTDEAHKKAPIRYWLERIEQRLHGLLPAPAKLKLHPGVSVYRFHQSPLQSYDRVLVFGLEPHHLEPTQRGEWYWSYRERELLGLEFSIQSRSKEREGRLQCLKHWMKLSREVTFYSAQYGPDGSEKEVFEEFPYENSAFTSQGAHPRWLRSYGWIPEPPPQEVRFPNLPQIENHELNATGLDYYSRCAFLGLVRTHWKLWDTREPDSELWPEVRGQLLHSVISELLKTELKTSPEKLLDLIWSRRRPSGLLQSQRIEITVKSKLLKILNAFIEKEREVQGRLKSKIISMDQLTLTKRFESHVQVTGRPDRIDEYPHGLFIMDYKSSTGLPNGKKMLEEGYRLQLPFYAVAAESQLKKPILGVQFIELSEKASRNQGIFFKADNTTLTKVRSNSGSLMTEEDPKAIWMRLESIINDHLIRWKQGIFDPKPKYETECDRCQARDLCGRNRKIEG